MGKYRILIVDDDDDARRILSMALRPRFETVEAGDGLAALSRLEMFEPDLALIDIMMPMMDGYQLCQALRKHPRFSNIPVLFLSAYGSKENAKQSYAVGGNLFIAKPVDPDRVIRNINITIEHEAPQVRAKRYTVEQLEGMEPEPGAAPSLSSPEPSAPAAEPALGGASKASLGPAAPAGAKPRILIVDDDAETRLMIDLTLRDSFEITKAANGMEAVERMVDYEPDIALLDIMMPRMNGYQLLQSIRRNPMFHRMPVIVLSAKSARRDREYAEKLGASAYLAKPYHVDELLRTLDQVMAAPGFFVRAKSRSIEQIHGERIQDEKAQTDDILRKARTSSHDRRDDPFGRIS